MSNKTKQIDCLSLLALKVAPNTFDISSTMQHISIRDQIVRARLLVRDLTRADTEIESILIIGCSAAGISAALTASECGISQVVAVDVADKPFSLLASVKTRYVGPFMYEWPSSVFDNQSYPYHTETPWEHSDALSALTWQVQKPCRASELAQVLTQNLKTHLHNNNGHSPSVLLSVDKKTILNFLTNRKNSPTLTIGKSYSFNNKNNLTAINITPKYVLIAAGMGRENCTLLNRSKSIKSKNFTGKSFWKNDELLSKKYTKKDTIIVGGGDGAIQDALRILTGEAHPLDYLKILEQDNNARQFIQKISNDLLTADRQHRLYNTWSNDTDGYKQINNTCIMYAKRAANNQAICNAVIRTMRNGKGSVSLFVREGFFGKSYLLNRFLVHLIHECYLKFKISNPQGKMAFRLVFGASATSYWNKKTSKPKKIPTGVKVIPRPRLAKRENHKKHTVRIMTSAKAKPFPKGIDKYFIYNADEIVVRYGIEKGTTPGLQMIQLSSRKSKYRTTLSRVELPFVAGKI